VIKYAKEHGNRTAKRIRSSTNKIIIYEAKRWAVAHSVTDFAGETS
jgi:hypothetical protein